MSLREKLMGTDLIKSAMRAKDKLKLETVKQLKSEISRKEDIKTKLSDGDIITMIKKNISNIKDNISLFEKMSGKEEDIKDSKREISILAEFIPTQMSHEEMEKEVEALIFENNFNGMGDMGKLMGIFSKKFIGRSDNKVASNIIKQKLNN